MCLTGVESMDSFESAFAYAIAPMRLLALSMLISIIYGLMGFYIASGVSSFILYEVAKLIFRI